MKKLRITVLYPPRSMCYHVHGTKFCKGLSRPNKLINIGVNFSKSNIYSSIAEETQVVYQNKPNYGLFHKCKDDATLGNVSSLHQKIKIDAA